MPVLTPGEVAIPGSLDLELERHRNDSLTTSDQWKSQGLWVPVLTPGEVEIPGSFASKMMEKSWTLGAGTPSW